MIRLSAPASMCLRTMVEYGSYGSRVLRNCFEARGSRVLEKYSYELIVRVTECAGRSAPGAVETESADG